NGLPEHGGKRVGQRARDNVRAAGGRVGNDEANGPVGIAFRVLRGARPDREQGSQQQQGGEALAGLRRAAAVQRVAAVDRYLARCRVGSWSASRRNGSPSSRVTIISSTV